MPCEKNMYRIDAIHKYLADIILRHIWVNTDTIDICTIHSPPGINMIKIASPVIIL